MALSSGHFEFRLPIATAGAHFEWYFDTMRAMNQHRCDLQGFIDGDSKTDALRADADCGVQTRSYRHRC